MTRQDAEYNFEEILYRKMRGHLLFLFSLIFFQSTFAEKFPLFEYSPDVEYASVQPYLFILEDIDDKNSIETIQNVASELFVCIESAKDTLKRNVNYWVALRIVNVTSVEQHLFLESGLTESIDFYFQNKEGAYELKEYGYDIADAHKEYAEPISQVIGFSLSPSEEKLFYFKIKSELNLKPNPLFKIKTQNQFHDEVEIFNLFQGIFHGLIWMLIAYIFFLYINLRERVYLYYIIYAASFSIAIFILLGYPRHYLFPHLNFHVLYSELIIQIGSIFYLLLFKHALDINKYAPGFVKPLKYIVRFLSVGVILTTAFLFIDFYTYNLLSQIFVFLELIMFFILLGKLIVMKNPITPYMLIGNISLSVGALIIVVGLLFLHEPFLKYFPIFQGGVTIEVLFFVLGLSRRFQLTELEKRRVQDELIKELRSKEKFQQKVNDDLERKVQERTQEINQSKEEIVQQQEYIEQRNELLELSNKKLTDNLKYAGFVQNALLQDFRKVRPFFKDAFVLYKPHSYVSGDFYMFYKLDTDRAIILAADCTGHGVPGAMLTMIAQDFLTEIIISRNIHKPDVILSELEKGMVSRLINISSNERLHEGLDIGIVLIDKSKKELLFSGAKCPLLYVNEGKAMKTHGELYGIGGFPYNKREKTFTCHTFTFKEGDAFYLYSDGYYDQLQNNTGKKFKSKRFTSLLEGISDEKMSEQKKILLQMHKEWKGYADQTDDIIIVGFKL